MTDSGSEPSGSPNDPAPFGAGIDGAGIDGDADVGGPAPRRTASRSRRQRGERTEREPRQRDSRMSDSRQSDSRQSDSRQSDSRQSDSQQRGSDAEVDTGSASQPRSAGRPGRTRRHRETESEAQPRPIRRRARRERTERPSSRPERERAPSKAQSDSNATDGEVWTPTARLRRDSAVQVFGSSRCDERGALVVDVALPKRGHLDPNALRVVQRLVRAGFEAYLVGGCVRDLLLGRRPKDFDVATEAHPREVKRLFRNGRIIGRRFKLVHVVYGPEVVETATFRAAPRSLGSGSDDPTVGDLMIVDDNEFGTAAEDALRRDFTINGLFLDPIEGEILDYVDGLEDVEARVIRTIGDPRVRIAEDPVRILRAIKFASRLGFSIHPQTWAAMVEHADGLAQAAAPRVVEEILRLLQSGHAHEAFRLLDDVGALPVLLPALSRWRNACGASADADDDGWRVLTALDERVARGEAPTTSFCLAALFAPAYLDAWDSHSANHEHHVDTEALHLAARLLSPLSAVARLSRRDVSQAKRLLANQPRFAETPSRRFKPLLFAHAPEFDESLDLLALRIQAGCEERDLLDLWLERREEAREVPSEIIDRERKTSRKRRRRRRKPRSSSS